jgi:hypothetical protein
MDSQLLGLILIQTLATPAFAEVNISVNIGPPIVVHERPTMLYLAEPGMFVAVGVPYDIYFLSGRYHYYHATTVLGIGYGGPWLLSTKSLPPDCRSTRLCNCAFQANAGSGFQGPNFKGSILQRIPGRESTTTTTRQQQQPGNQGDKGNKGNGRGRGRASCLLHAFALPAGEGVFGRQ